MDIINTFQANLASVSSHCVAKQTNGSIMMTGHEARLPIKNDMVHIDLANTAMSQQRILTSGHLRIILRVGFKNIQILQMIKNLRRKRTDSNHNFSLRKVN